MNRRTEIPRQLTEIPTETTDGDTETTDGDTETTDGEEDTDGSSDFEILKVGDEGIEVIRIQMRLRDLGYLNYRATGLYYSMTEQAVIEFQENNGLDIDGRVGKDTYDLLFSTGDLTRKKLSIAIDVASGPEYDADSSPGTGVLGDWVEVINPAFEDGDIVTVTDYNTGKSFQMKRTGGVNHATVEVVSAADYDVYIACFDNEPTWEKRAVLVTIDGVDYAASLFGNPSGDDEISDNTMAGHTELYFYGSTSDIFGFADKYHDKMVLIAAGEEVTY